MEGLQNLKKEKARIRELRLQQTILGSDTTWFEIWEVELDIQIAAKAAEEKAERAAARNS